MKIEFLIQTQPNITLVGNKLVLSDLLNGYARVSSKLNSLGGGGEDIN